ncbi:MAG TPA: efflux RND transporter periplasmic adaptor subunit [Candidatus Acidoferrum sp.]|nr:efflux RND transporter periplasmic adaptor subunit [Candidatus Acidoferrum sp.]
MTLRSGAGTADKPPRICRKCWRTLRALAAILLALTAMPAAAAEFRVAGREIPDLKAVFATVESLHLTPARTRIGGTIGELAVQEGSRIEVGQRLAQVVDPKLPLQLAALDAEIESLHAQQTFNELDLARMQKLMTTGAATQSRVDEAQTALNVVKANVAAKTAERAVVAEQLKEGDVLAPANGRVLTVQVVNGTVVMPGDTVATIAADAYVLRMRVPERHARFIHAGDRVLVGAHGLEAAPEKLVEGRVRLVYPELDQGRVVADVDVAGLGDFFVGERTRVFVSTGTRPAIVVPAAYVYKRFGISYVRVKDVGETVVQAGLPTEDGIEILSGLRPGDVLLPAEPAP